MGTCCCGNKPSGKFVGTWVGNGDIQLTIDENGKIAYNKQVGSLSGILEWVHALTVPYQHNHLLFCTVEDHRSYSCFRLKIAKSISPERPVSKKIRSSSVAAAVVFAATMKKLARDHKYAPMESCSPNNKWTLCSTMNFAFRFITVRKIKTRYSAVRSPRHTRFLITNSNFRRGSRLIQRANMKAEILIGCTSTIGSMSSSRKQSTTCNPRSFFNRLNNNTGVPMSRKSRRYCR